MVALCVIVLISILTIFIFNLFGWNKKIMVYITIGMLVILFSLSYRKQTKYIKARVQKQTNLQEENS